MPDRSALPADNVIPFPRSARPATVATSDTHRGVLISQDGIVYGLNALLRQLPRARRADLLDMGPFPPQDLWSIVMQRWPDLARAAMAAVRPPGTRSH